MPLLVLDILGSHHGHNAREHHIASCAVLLPKQIDSLPLHEAILSIEEIPPIEPGKHTVLVDPPGLLAVIILAATAGLNRVGFRLKL